MKRLVIIAACAVSMFSCSKDEKKTVVEKKPTTEVKPDDKDTKEPVKTNMTIAGDLGEIDQAMVQKKFDQSKEHVQKCIIDGIGGDAYIGGSLDFTFRINLDGTVKKLDFKSTVGHRSIEKCIYNFAMGLKFVKPKGGEGKVDYPFSFEPTREIKKNWKSENLGSSYKKVRKHMMKCSDGTEDAPSNFTVVFYLLPDSEIGPSGVTSGKKLVSDKFYKCIQKSLKKVKFPDPMGTVAKVTLEIEP